MHANLITLALSSVVTPIGLWYASRLSNSSEVGPAPAIEIRGRVIDGDHGVADAKVVVLFYKNRILSSLKKKYGFYSDARGQFAVRIELPFDYDSISIEASAPSNAYGRVEFQGNPVTIAVAPLPEYLKSRRCASYQYFMGQFSANHRLDEMAFLDGGWETRTPSEIRRGDPGPRRRFDKP